MCICIIKPSGKTIQPFHLKNSFDHNPDGIGFAYVKNGESAIRVSKGHMDYQSFIAAYSVVQPEDIAVVHFRRGMEKRVDLCHPWPVSNMQMFHNGTFNVNVPENCVSDTDYVARLIGPFLSKYDGVLKHPFFTMLMKEWIWYNPYSSSGMGSPGNVIVFLSPSGEYTIINEEGKHNTGGWHKGTGCWFSNSCYLSRYIPPAPVVSHRQNKKNRRKNKRKLEQEDFGGVYMDVRFYFSEKDDDFWFFGTNNVPITSKSLGGIKYAISNAIKDKKVTPES